MIDRRGLVTECGLLDRSSLVINLGTKFVQILLLMVG